MRDFSLPCKRVKLKRRSVALINAEYNGPLESNDIPDGKEPKITFSLPLQEDDKENPT